MKPEYLTQEKPWGDAPHRPDLLGEVVQGRRGRLLVTVYRAGGAGLHPTVLLSHGFPGIEKNLDLAQALRRLGFHVVTYHYSGCWNSAGAYRFSHNLEDSRAVLAFVRERTDLGFDPQRLYAVGHSVGGFVTAHLFAAHPVLRAAVILAPCDLGEAMAQPADAESKRLLRGILEDGAPWLWGATAAELWQEVAERQAEFRLSGLAQGLAERPLLCIGAAWDECCPPECHCLPWVRAVAAAGGEIAYEEMQTDHSFSDLRLTLAERVAAFLLRQLDGKE